MHFDDHSVVAIDKPYWLCCEISSLIHHKQNDAKLTARVQMSNELLIIIRLAEHQGCQYFDTLDEL
jgi:hypothetical protein